MQLRSSSIGALILVLIITLLVVHFWPQMNQFLSAMGDIGPGHSPHQQFVGLIAFGVAAAAFLALVKILMRDRP